MAIFTHVHSLPSFFDFFSHIFIRNGLSRPTNFQSSVVQSEGVIFDQNTGTITFELEESGRVELSVFDIQGRTVWSGSTSGAKGINQINGIHIPNSNLGVYFYRLKSKTRTESGKIILSN